MILPYIVKGKSRHKDINTPFCFNVIRLGLDMYLCTWFGYVPLDMYSLPLCNLKMSPAVLLSSEGAFRLGTGGVSKVSENF